MLPGRRAQPPAQPKEKVRQTGKNPLRKVKELPPEEERFSSAPVYESVYTADDYGADGHLKRLKDVPLGVYPDALAKHLATFNQGDFAPPPTPIAPPHAPAASSVPKAAASKKPISAATGISKKPEAKPAPKPKPSISQLGTQQQKEIDIKDASLAKRMLVEKGPPGAQGKSRVEMAPLPPPPRTADGKYDGSDPPEFRDPAHHYIAIVSWVVNRHPREDAILEHRFQQYVARKEDRYNPLEDPPVDLRQITPVVLMRVTKTFTKGECEYKNGETVAAYAEKLRDVAGWNVLTLLCGEPQPLPVADSVRGQYKDPALQQQMGAFYDNQEAGKQDIMARIKADQEEAHRVHTASLEQTAKERAAGTAAEHTHTHDEPSDAHAAENERQRQMREAVGVAVETEVQTEVQTEVEPSWADQTEQEEATKAAASAAKAKPTTWAGVAAAAASLPPPEVPAATDDMTPAQSPYPANNNIINVARPVGKRAGVRRAAPKKQ